jgi:hypothetical protein
MSAMVAAGIGVRWRVELRVKLSSWQAASASIRLAANAKRFIMGDPAIFDLAGHWRRTVPL